MFRMEKEFTAENGYHVVEIHDKDEAFRQAVIEAMKAKGYDVHGFSDLGTSVQYNFVTAEFAEVLKERHHHSCRNSAGGIMPGRSLGGHYTEVLIPKDRESTPGGHLYIPIDHQAYNDTIAALDTPNPARRKVDFQVISRVDREVGEVEICDYKQSPDHSGR
jgi:hypothetical protein